MAPPTVRHADLWGTREAKHGCLAEQDVTTTKWETIEPASPTYLFKPWNRDLDEEYGQWPKITEVMPVNSVGIVTARDRLAIRWTKEEILSVVKDFAALLPRSGQDTVQPRSGCPGLES